MYHIEPFPRGLNVHGSDVSDASEMQGICSQYRLTRIRPHKTHCHENANARVSWHTAAAAAAAAAAEQRQHSGRNSSSNAKQRQPRQYVNTNSEVASNLCSVRRWRVQAGLQSARQPEQRAVRGLLVFSRWRHAIVSPSSTMVPQLIGWVTGCTNRRNAC